MAGSGPWVAMYAGFLGSRSICGDEDEKAGSGAGQNEGAAHRLGGARGTVTPRVRKRQTPGCSSSRTLPDSGAGMSDGTLGRLGSCAWSPGVTF